MRHLLARADGRRIAVVVNEFGELGLDRELLLGFGDEACGEGDIVEFANGCLCCTVGEDFLRPSNGFSTAPYHPGTS